MLQGTITVADSFCETYNHHYRHRGTSLILYVNPPVDGLISIMMLL